MIHIIKKYLINFFEILNGGFVEPERFVPVDTLDVFIILASVIS
mgnify:CR=1